MKIKKTNLFILFLSTLFLLTGCEFERFVNDLNSEIFDDDSSSNITEVEPMIIPEGYATNANYAFKFDSVEINKSSTPTTGKNYTTQSNFAFNLRDLRDTQDFDDPYTVGEQRILVIPVRFSDYKTVSYCRFIDGGCDKAISDLDKAFFGDPSYTGWESVSSFYYKSSYGKLKLSGRVTDWFTIDKTAAQINSLSSKLYADPTYYILRKAVNWYQKTYGDLSYYDQDGDNLVDAVWLVYDRPTLSLSDTIWWAYTFWDYENESSNLKAYTYAWASFEFLYEGQYSKNGIEMADAHTFIHETGHILGLDDYYSYNSSNPYAAAGALDMMDYNIGDHNAYSKMLMGWVNPLVVQDSTTISINPFESSGDCILVRDYSSWNKTPLDEYLLIEFITPTGLNKKDAEDGYVGNDLQHFTVPGIKIYHVDSRIGKFDQYGYLSNYTDSITSGGYSYYTDIVESNTTTSMTDNTHLLHLIEANKKDTFKNGAPATNATLFKEGSTFTPSSYSMFFANGTKFNDGSDIGYNISIDSITSSKATLIFTKI